MNGTNRFLRKSAVFRENLRFPVVFCENLRFSAKICASEMLQFPEKSENLQNQRKSAKKLQSLSLLIPLQNMPQSESNGVFNHSKLAAGLRSRVNLRVDALFRRRAL